MTKTKVEPKIINLSKKELTHSQISVLLYGPKFTPTPRKDISELENDIQKFCRKLRLMEFFNDKDPTTNDSILKLPSKFNPARNRDIVLDNYIDYLTKQPLNAPNDTKGNLSKNELQALSELKQDQTIIIKEADKGGAFVIMDRDFYEKSITDMLNDSKTYQKLRKSQDLEIRKKLENFSKKYSKCLTKDEQKYIYDFDMKTSNIYGLPKIHKSKKIIEEIKVQNLQYVTIHNITDLKFRPIIAGPTCPTSHLSALVDEILKPMLPEVKSYVKDDLDFLHKLNRELSEGDIFVTYDVESLYTNIDHQLGKTAISFWLDKNTNKVHSRFRKNMILEATDIVLRNNTFHFNDQYFLQLVGTAMGTKMAPTYANLVLGYLETKLYDQMQEMHGLNFRLFLENNWKRYLDDCFIIWNDQHGNTEDFDKALNELHRKINFTKEIGTDTISFLDITLLKENGKISTDIYHKETDTFNYLPYKSCHPRHIRKNIPFTLARQIRMLTENTTMRKIRYEELRHRLRDKGYPLYIINQGISKADSLTNEQLDRNTTKQEESLVVLSTHNPNNPSLETLVRSSINILDTSPNMKSALSNRKLIFAKRQPPNLKRLLSKAEFRSNTSIPKVSKCDKNCETCKSIIEGSTIEIKSTGKVFKVKYNMDCNTRNLIYVMICEGCGEQYVGETSNPLKTRMTVHRQQIRTPELRQLNVSKHIAECGNGSFKIFPIYKMNTESTIDRRNKEHYFINCLKPSLNAS